MGAINSRYKQINKRRGCEFKCCLPLGFPWINSTHKVWDTYAIGGHSPATTVGRWSEDDDGWWSFAGHSTSLFHTHRVGSSSPSAEDWFPRSDPRCLANKYSGFGGPLNANILFDRANDFGLFSFVVVGNREFIEKANPNVMIADVRKKTTDH